MAPRYFEPPKIPPYEGNEHLFRTLDVYHPGYPTNSYPLLSLHASDNGGLHYTIVYYACCIVAGNVWHEDEGRNSREDGNDDNPFLSTSVSPDRSFRIEVPDDDILPVLDDNERYYFHISGRPNSQRYPIVPSFEEWIFPKGKTKLIPRPWRALRVETSYRSNTDNHPTSSVASTSSHVTNNQESSSTPPITISTHETRTESCRITGDIIGLDYAHIIPSSVEEWFMANNMREHAKNAVTIERNSTLHGTCNLIPLRCDIHRFFDHNNLLLVPKPEPKAKDIFKLRTHMLRCPDKAYNTALRMISQYNDIYCLPLQYVPIEYLFARFAWSLFSDVTLLLFRGVKNVKFSIFLSKPIDGHKRGFIQKDVKDKFPKPRAGSSTASQGGGKRSRTTFEEDTNREGLDHTEQVDDDVRSVNSFDTEFYESYWDDLYGPCTSEDDDGSIPTNPSFKRLRLAQYIGQSNDDINGDIREDSEPELSLSIPSIGSSDQSAVEQEATKANVRGADLGFGVPCIEDKPPFS